MNRYIIAAVAALSLASYARAEGEEATVDVAALQGKVTALEEQYAETKTDVAALKRLKISGYMQARWAYLECVGSSAPGKCTYNKLGTSYADRDNFFIRRGRFKAVYDADLAQFVLQLDAIPSGISVKEAYATVKLPYGMAIDAGLQLMPFGYDVGVRSSSDLDLLERYRGAGYWLAGEYDVGAALRASYGHFNFRGGLFNGNGFNGGTSGNQGKDNDQMKDFIGRLGFDYGMVTGGVSGWYGNTRDYKAFPNKTYQRSRIGADLQVYLDLLPIGGTALKGEYIAGKTGIGTQTDSTGAVSAIYGADPAIAGHAWHATLVQNLGKTFQAAARYEQMVKDNSIGITSSKPYRVKEIDELDVALHAYIGGNYKLSFLYAHPMVGKTVGTGTDAQLDGSVKKSDQFVVQGQAKF